MQSQSSETNANPISAPTAGFLVIGDEILSGRTKDKNIGTIAEQLTFAGIDLKEVRVVCDDEAAIINAVNDLRARYTYVFTSGGIGPTHDDITADSVAAAFGVGITEREDALALLREIISEDRLNAARRRMARIPDGADLITNPISKAPGFRLGNVHVLAGVPSIFQAMLDAVLPTLETGEPILSQTVDAGTRGIKEGDIAEDLGRIQNHYSNVSIGSYPGYNADGGFKLNVVVRSRDPSTLKQVVSEIETAIHRLKERI